MMVGVFDRVFETAPVFRAEKHNTKRRIFAKEYSLYVNFAACQRSDDLLYEEIPKGPLRHGAALVLALLLGLILPLL